MAVIVRLPVAGRRSRLHPGTRDFGLCGRRAAGRDRGGIFPTGYALISAGAVPRSPTASAPLVAIADAMRCQIRAERREGAVGGSYRILLVIGGRDRVEPVTPAV